MAKSDCCIVDHRRKKCIDLDHDDTHCGKLAKCCVGIHNFGQHNKCLSAVRKCRQLGNAYDPIAPLKPLPVDYIYTQTPGYATTGDFVEHFDGGMITNLMNQILDVRCILKHTACSLIIAIVAKSILGTKVTFTRLATLTFLIALIKCCAAKL